MDPITIRNTIIKPKLVDVFGRVFASSLLAMAITEGLKGTTPEEKLGLMVDTICSDPQVVGMWGKSGTERQKREWLELL